MERGGFTFNGNTRHWRECWCILDAELKDLSMMRFSTGFGAFSLAALLAFTAQAAEPTATESKSIVPKALVPAGEQVAIGDIISMKRQFADWSLNCDLRLSQNKRLCAVQQIIASGQSLVLWRVTTSEDDKPVIIISMSKNFVANKAFRMGFAGLEKVIPESDWRCAETGCVSVFAFDSLLQPAIIHSQNVKFDFTVKGDDGAETPVVMQGSMNGFSQAIDAGVKDPFGKTVVQSPAKEQPPKKKDKQAALPSVKKQTQTAEAKPKTPAIKPKTVAVFKSRSHKPAARVTEVAFYRAPLY